MGFAAAGIALALQNVILSLAGYFYLSGRFGIRIGDRVEISGIDGDVLEIGMFKMTLMELNKADKSHQPTGRVVVFPNSVVFQTNGNFFKQLPGSNFTWNELRLTLAPDCDYRVAEKRLGEVVTSVFARYRDAIQRDYRGIERDLNIRIDTPRPQTRLRFGDSGIELVLRYPVDIHTAAQTSDEISRRLIDAIAREPALKLVPSAAPLLQPANPPESNHDGHSGGTETHDSSEPQPPNALDSSKAANAAAAEVGLETANAVVRTGEAEAAAPAPLPPGDKSKSNS
jgi:small-conductance mechanosensitive channel